eukprot:CAMPEP_0204636022 /NCGR_PEP_ID=MMETSP0717-20131115/32973_1 /ASSEMBLY_ACC=CAM_ASM_000666 /TAXON_ID=230516 /ORGANISM="Chaetoceros curvisetus" /LENGTH=81 /DNA_ID=CAMNT_0051654971 /DNA_START=95 /DNA_END=336 /DNA_ORIENTATION=-
MVDGPNLLRPLQEFIMHYAKIFSRRVSLPLSKVNSWSISVLFGAVVLSSVEGVSSFFRSACTQVFDTMIPKKDNKFILEKL